MRENKAQMELPGFREELDHCTGGQQVRLIEG